VSRVDERGWDAAAIDPGTVVSSIHDSQLIAANDLRLRHLLVAQRQTPSHDRRARSRFTVDGNRHCVSAIRPPFQLRPISHRATWSPLACADGRSRDGPPLHGGGRAGGHSRSLSAGASACHAAPLAASAGACTVARTSTATPKSVLTAGQLRLPVEARQQSLTRQLSTSVVLSRDDLDDARAHAWRRLSPTPSRPFDRTRRTASGRSNARAAASHPGVAQAIFC
jgi:hypothetical protein